MPRPRNEVPTYKLHTSTGLARCWVGGKWVTLGKYGSPESKAEFERILAELRSGAPATSVAAVPDAVTVDQLLLLFLNHAEKHYRRPDGTPTDQVTEFTNAAKPLHKLYGHTPAVQFGPKAAQGGASRRYIDADNLPHAGRKQPGGEDSPDLRMGHRRGTDPALGHHRARHRRGLGGRAV